MTRYVVNFAFMSSPHPIWTATLEGYPELIGHGPSKQDAVYDLFGQLADREADDENDENDELRFQCETVMR